MTKKAKPVAKMTRGEKVCAFIETYCLAPEGQHIGKPIVLAHPLKSCLKP